MEGKAVLFILLPVIVSGSFPTPKSGDPITAVEGLVTRLLGEKYVSEFIFQVIDSSNGYDAFELDHDAKEEKPILRGNNGVALASALNHYLKYFCNCSVSWGRDGTGDQLKLPSVLPLPEPMRKESPVLFR